MLETERLLIIPLTYEQLVKYGQNDGSLEQELCLNISPRVISAELAEALEKAILPRVADTSRNYLYSTLWSVILKEKNQMVGDLCFMGEPNDMGEVEIGYGTYPAFRGKGYMAEAVGGMVGCAAEQPEVRAVVASTNKDNPASMAVLVKNGFVRTGETDSLIHWKKELAR
ncbi:MAG TPA: GNAT family N-acetyltransferase [Williamwhitmania sp.]|nr:GNAT family N-acetyltransferase [Williamwhitmania sp.]